MTATSRFPAKTVDDAAERIRPTLLSIQGSGQRLPDAVARMAAAPETLRGFLAAHTEYERSSLSQVEREIVTLVVAAHHGCHVCIRMHSAILERAAPDTGLAADLVRGTALTDDRYEALRRFTATVIETRGAVPETTLDDFLGHGFTSQNALDVVLGVGTYTISTYANRLTGAGR